MKPKAFVALKIGYSPSSGTVNELQQFVIERGAPYKHPRWVEFIDSLPRTATGKVQRFNLRGS